MSKENFLEYKLAKNLRKIIEDNKLNKLGSIYGGFLAFPSACCDQTSEILQKYFIDNGINEYCLVRKIGKYNGYYYDHVWLENENYAIDITGDQFNGKNLGFIFDKIYFIEKENYFFNKINSEKEEFYGTNLETCDKQYFNYLKFYNSYVKNSKI